jgi:hypothetical protein
LSSKEWREKNPEKARSYSRLWRKKNPEKAARESAREYERYKTWRMVNRAGIPKDLVKRALELKDGPCWICGAGPDAQKYAHHADHDHESGEFRGILCGRCNIAIGNLWDSPELCEAAAVYLRNPPGTNGIVDPDLRIPTLLRLLSRREEI